MWSDNFGGRSQLKIWFKSCKKWIFFGGFLIKINNNNFEIIKLKNNFPGMLFWSWRDFVERIQLKDLDIRKMESWTSRRTNGSKVLTGMDCWTKPSNHHCCLVSRTTLMPLILTSFQEIRVFLVMRTVAGTEISKYLSIVVWISHRYSQCEMKEIFVIWTIKALFSKGRLCFFTNLVWSMIHSWQQRLLISIDNTTNQSEWFFYISRKERNLNFYIPALCLIMWKKSSWR